MQTVLDLDLDFFVWPIARDITDEGHRLDPREYHTRTEIYVRSFLESRCGLSTTHPIPGRCVVNHVEAFPAWREWITRGSLSKRFDVVHVDAHADLGAGSWNPSPRYFETELLRLPL